jgi:hypothetical protein
MYIGRKKEKDGERSRKIERKEEMIGGKKEKDREKDIE